MPKSNRILTADDTLPDHIIEGNWENVRTMAMIHSVGRSLTSAIVIPAG